MQGDWAYAAAPLSFLVILPVIRRAGPVWVVDLAAGAGVAACFFTIAATPAEVGEPADAGGRPFFELALFAAMPLLCGSVFTPRWGLYAVLCVVHAAHAGVLLTSLGPMPPLLVCLASFLGVAVSYLQERRSREHFVRAHTA